MKRSGLPVAALTLLVLSFAGAWHAATDDQATVSFLSQEEAQEAFVAESIEPYFSLLMPAEMAAKTRSAVTGDTLEAQREATRQRYRASALAFTDSEKA